MRTFPLCLALAALLAGCGAAADSAAPPASPAGGHCRSRSGLPDPHCTPGAADPRVDQQDIRRTICEPGYTARVRPPSSYTTSLKRRQLAAYGWYAGHSLAGYEEDHLIPLELGGSPSDPRNLWPEARRGSTGDAGQKDSVENRLHRQVCDGQIGLRRAQQEIARNWEAESRR